MSEAHDPGWYQDDDGLWHTEQRLDIDAMLADHRTRAKWKQIGVAALVAFGAVLVIAGCGGPPKSVTRVSDTDGITLTHAAPSTKDAAAAYLAAVAPANAAGDTFQAAYAKLGSNASAADQQKVVTPYADALVVFTQALARIQWPTPAIKADATALISASAVLAGDLRSVANQTLLSTGSFTAQLAADNGKDQGAVTILRADLGLGPQR